jgi:preprotein translocase subunit SecD
MNMKYRLLALAGLVIACIWALWPRDVIERVQIAGSDEFEYVDVKRVPLKRGLDLRGGMYMELGIDESKTAVADRDDALERAIIVVRNRIDEFGVVDPNVQRSGEDRIIVELPGIDDPESAVRLIQQAAFLEFQITDMTNGLERVLPRMDAILRERGITGATAPGSTDAAAAPGLRGLFGDTAATDLDTAATQADTSTLDLTAPGSRVGALSSKISAGSLPGEFLVSVNDYREVERYLALPEIRAAVPPGKEILWGTDSIPMGAQWYRMLYMLDSRPIMTGEYLTDARPVQSPTEGTVVSFELNNVGGRAFRIATTRHLKDYMAIVLDNRVIGRPPVINGAIGNRGQITMAGRDLAAAQHLALVLKSGALPVPLQIMEQRNIGASLGQDSIDQGLRAGIIAVGLVILIMIVYYRVSGVLAVTGLVFYVLLTAAMLAGFNAVLTLPGIAGFVLSIGMAVDANVLIFERIREELDNGKTARTAVDEGFRHAMSAIVDSNVTTALTAAVLYQYGTGPVRGFAVILLAGIAASMVTAIFIVRTFFLLRLSRMRAAQTLSI